MPKLRPTGIDPPLSPTLIRLIDALAEAVIEEYVTTMRKAEIATSKPEHIARNKPSESEAPQAALLSFDNVAARVGLGRTRIYAGMVAGDFPKPVKLGRRSLWVASEIDQWIAERIADRNASTRPPR